jgi:hypothetical protein
MDITGHGIILTVLMSVVPAWYGNNFITNNGQIVYYTNDNGLNWHQSSISNLHSFRFDDNGILYAIMDVTSDSDGLWRSNDFGANWVNILYTSALVCIGPVFNNNVTLGWRECYEDSSYGDVSLQWNRISL